MEISPLKQTDEAFVQNWLYQFLSEHLDLLSKSLNLNWSKTDIENHMMKNRLLHRAWNRIKDASHSPDAVVRTARIQEQIVGIIYASIEEESLYAYKIGFLHWVFVEEAHRNLGYGKQLIEIAQSWIERKNPIGIELYVNESNQQAKTLYQKLGFFLSDQRMLKTIRS